MSGAQLGGVGRASPCSRGWHPVGLGWGQTFSSEGKNSDD